MVKKKEQKNAVILYTLYFPAENPNRVRKRSHVRFSRVPRRGGGAGGGDVFGALKP